MKTKGYTIVLNPANVALHPEGVDKIGYRCLLRRCGGRPPPGGAWIKSRRDAGHDRGGGRPPPGGAWIEIFLFVVTVSYTRVALHPEGVDKNLRSRGT